MTYHFNFFFISSFMACLQREISNEQFCNKFIYRLSFDYYFLLEKLGNKVKQELQE